MSSEIEEVINAEPPELNKRFDLPLVWLLPVIALLVSAWLIYKSASEKGLVITIDFPTAEGLDVDKTKIRYLNVDIGKVTAISINDDSQTIRVSAQMDSSANKFLKEGTRFWVVKPQVGLSGVSGLNTIFSGAFIELEPGSGKQQLAFKGLTEAPTLASRVDGRQFILEVNNLGSMRAGTPINFHGIQVGQVLSQRLSDDANVIEINIFVNAPYDKFVRKNTRFWIDSGIDLSAGANGFKVRTGPLISLLGGGIAFRTSAKDTLEDIKPDFSKFTLYETYDESTQMTYNNTLKYVMHFKGSVRGLTEGAPVQLRGIPIGKVIDINLELDKKTAEIRVPVVVELEPDRIQFISDDNQVTNQDVFEQLINKGLKAQLQMGSLVTGQLLIDLDFHPGLVIANTQHLDGSYPEFPTTASSFEEFTQSAQGIMEKLNRLPLDKISNEVNKTLISLQGTSKAATTALNTANGTLSSATDALTTAKVTFNEAGGTIKSAQSVLGILEPGSNGYYEFHKLLQELTQTASSVRQLTDYLEQHPESLIRGKKQE